MKIQLLSDRELPKWFEYPPAFLRMVEQGLINFDPWLIVSGEYLNDLNLGLKTRFPDRGVVPFAVRQDNDDVACWEEGSSAVKIIHDYASPGWESRNSYGSFWDWLRFAVEETIDYEDD